MTEYAPTPVVAEQTMILGPTLTVITQYDCSLFDSSLVNPMSPDAFIAMATRRFERLLRQAVPKETPA